MCRIGSHGLHYSFPHKNFSFDFISFFGAGKIRILRPHVEEKLREKRTKKKFKKKPPMGPTPC